MKKTLYLLLLLVMALAVAFSMTACDKDKDDDGDNASGECDHIFNTDGSEFIYEITNFTTNQRKSFTFRNYLLNA